MKRIFLLTAIFLATSCTHQHQKMKFDLTIDHEKSNFNNAGAIDLVAFDDRFQKEVLGTKIFGDEKIQITSDQNLTEILLKEIGNNLTQKGFRKGLDKIVEIHLENLKYKAERNFFVGTSEAESTIKIVVKNLKSGEKFTKNFSLSTKGKHFLAPLESTDEAIINEILRDTILDIVNDASFLKSLSK